MNTELDILNHVLVVSGETPVSSVETQHPSVLSARVTLQRVNRELQTKFGGLWFNTEKGITLQPDLNGYIVLPANTLFVDPCDTAINYVNRGGKLYDPVNHTFNIGLAVKVDLTVLLDIEDLPEVAYSYVLHKTAYDFYMTGSPEELKITLLNNAVSEAWKELHQVHLKSLDVNVYSNPAVSSMLAHVRNKWR